MKKVYSSFALLALLGTSGHAVEFQVTGSLDAFSKVGFNNQKINKAENIYPTESFMSVIGMLEVNADFFSQDQKDGGQKLTGSVGAAVGGPILDSTRLLEGGSQMDNYIGSQFVLYNAHLNYTTTKDDHSLNVKIGRYASSAQFYSGYTQGFEATYAYKGFKAWWFSSFGRGSVGGGQWLFDFGNKPANSPTGALNHGVHAFKPSYTFENGLYVSPFVYFSPEFYVAPMLELGFDSNPAFKGEGFRSTTKVIVMAPFHNKPVQNDYRYQDKAGAGGQTLSIKQQFDVNNYNFGLGLYKNFGHANAFVGTYGNAAIGGWDFWTGSVYDLAGALSNVVTKDATTGYVFAGGEHGKLSWNTLARLTSSPRADEQAALVSVGYAFPYNLKLWVKLEWQNVTTHKGYTISNSTGINMDDTSVVKLDKDQTSDRSHAMVLLSYSF